MKFDQPLSLLLLAACALVPSSSLHAEPAAPFACSWQDIQITDSRFLPAEGIEVVRPWLRLELERGTFYRLEACGVPVGLAWHGEGLVEAREFGVERSHLLHNRFKQLPGTVGLESALLIGSDGLVDDLLTQAGGEWQEAPVPVDIRTAIQVRIAAWEPQKGKGTRLPGNLLFSPAPELGGVLFDLKAQGIQRARPGESIELKARWFTYLWSSEGGFMDWEGGLWLNRSVGPNNESLLAAFPSEEEIGEAQDPWFGPNRVRRFDLIQAEVQTIVNPTYGMDRDLRDVAFSARLTLQAYEDSGQVVPLLLAEGRPKTLGRQWEPLTVHEVELDGEPVPFDRSGDRLFVRLPEPPAPGESFDVVVLYDGSVLEPDGQTAIVPLTGWNWYPRLHPKDRHVFASIVAFPKFWKVAASGQRIEDLLDGNMRVVTSRDPRPVEQGSVFIVDGRVKESRPPAGSGLPLLRIIRQPNTLAVTARMEDEVYRHLQQLQTLLGSFPYRELEIVERGVEGGWDGVPGVIVVPQFDSPPEQVVTTRVAGNTLLQALARQYLAADMGAASYHDEWLIESLAGWAECYALHAVGRSARCYGAIGQKRLTWRNLLESNGQSWLIGPVWLAQFSGAASANSQLRGPLVMHRLRLLIGDSACDDLLRRTALSYRGQRLSSRSFMLQAQAVAGLDLRTFFYGWIFATPQQPTARVTYRTEQAEDGTWRLHLEGFIDSGRDADPLPILAPVFLQMKVDGEEVIQRLLLTQESQETTVEGIPAEPRKLKLDPGRSFPGAVKLEEL